MRIWKLREGSPRAPQLARETRLSLLQAQLLINRGISDRVAALSFLSPKLSNLLNPALLPDMDQALRAILRAIEERRNIAVYGDYDADGLTAAALLIHFFAGLGIPVSPYIPHRLREGYGLNAGAIARLVRKRVGLIITVDCGTTDAAEILQAREAGIDIVVTDHHRVPRGFKPICPVVNPHRPDSAFPFKGLSGVGLAFFLAVAVRASLRERGYFRNRPEPDLRAYLDLVALGTVADMVPLLGQNRVLVKAGIEVMRASRWPGVNALHRTAAIDSSQVDLYDVAFKLAPRINAAGRMGDADLGITALTATNDAQAMDLARRMNRLNGQRRQVEQEILAKIESAFPPPESLKTRRTLVFAGRHWHRGVLGIVASRLVNKHYRPTLVLDIDNGVARGSGRSIDGFNLYEALAGLDHPLDRFGGHTHAAGFTLAADRIPLLARELEQRAHEALREEDLVPTLELDAELSLADLTPETMGQIAALSPFGPGNSEPLFYGHGLRVLDSRVVGERHLKLRVRQGEKVMEAIGFGLADRNPLPDRVNIVFVPEMNRWRGIEKAQLRILDLEETGEPSKLQNPGARNRLKRLYSVVPRQGGTCPPASAPSLE